MVFLLFAASLYRPWNPRPLRSQASRSGRSRKRGFGEVFQSRKWRAGRLCGGLSRQSGRGLLHGDARQGSTAFTRIRIPAASLDAVASQRTRC
jgi:hypothetical protein